MEDIIFYYPTGHAAHFEAGHPERPERVEAVRQVLEQRGWWGSYLKLSPVPVPPNVLQAVHSPEYLRTLRNACEWGERLDADTYTTPASYDLAQNAAGGALAVARAVWTGEARRGFALTRPPGHHATRSSGMGFCLLNNIALAAEDLLQSYGAVRLAIIDLDLHHGNGTQDIFWTRPDVFYLSIHQYPFYPGTGALDETGAGPGEGWTANIPLPPGSGDQAFRAAMDTLVMPLLAQKKPEMLLISFGFDPHWRDPLGHLMLSAGEYGRMIGKLVTWADQNCQSRIALFLEGGYDLQAAAACSQAAVSALLGLPFQDILGPSPRTEGFSYRRVIEAGRQLWGV